MVQSVREYVLRIVARHAGALAIAGALAVPLVATQGYEPVAALGGSAQRGPTPSSVTGEARVVDGDTIVVGAAKVRLEGLDAPEHDQTCARSWFGTWPCGREATEHLAHLVRGRTVTCTSHGTDVYGRMLGSCSTEGLDINRDMVRNGFAWAFVKYSQRFVEVEADARARKVGIWQAVTPPAWEWRAKRWAGAQQESRGEAPGGCLIKGNITRTGHIYHMPWDRWYDKTRIELTKGERWFCSEADAVAAGWRPSVPH